MNKTLNSIASLVNSDPNYKNIERKLDFDSFQSGIPHKLATRKAIKVAMPISAICVGLALAAILIPTISNAQKNNQQVDSPFAFVNGSIRVLKKHYVDGKVSSLSSDTTESIETNEDIIKNEEVTKINTWEGFKGYMPHIPGYARDDFKGIIDESTFVDNCVLSVSITATCDEVDPCYDGNGLVIENMQAEDGNLFVQISVPRKGLCEGFTYVTFIAVASKEDIDDNFEYSYQVIQRDTGDKGSYFYDSLFLIGDNA